MSTTVNTEDKSKVESPEKATPVSAAKPEEESKLSPEEKQAAKAKILRQVEFYFSDSNLLNDRFLFTTQSANEGWVPIESISQFQRMRKYRPISLIVEALRESKELLEVSKDGEMVRRKVPLPSNHNQVQLGIAKRSIVAEKFPEDITLDQLLEFFGKFAPINQVRMKRKSKKFTGSVIVEFQKEEDTKKYLEQEPKPKYGDSELKIVSKVAYDESRARSFAKRRGGRKSHGSDRKREESPERGEQSYRERDGEKKTTQDERTEEKKEDKKESN